MSGTNTTQAELPANTPAPDGEAPAPEAVAPAPAPKDDKPALPSWQDRRLANITRERREAEQREQAASADRDRYKAELEAFRRQQQPEGQRQAEPQRPEDVAKQAEERALEKFRAESEAISYNKACDALGVKVQAEFGSGLAEANQGWANAGLDQKKADHRKLLSLITKQDDGHKIYHDLGKDPNFVAHLLEMDPVEAAFALARRLTPAQAAELKQDAVVAAAQPAPEAPTPEPTPAPVPRVSSAPRPPAQPAASRGSTTGSLDIYDKRLSIDEYARRRAEQKAIARKH